MKRRLVRHAVGLATLISSLLIAGPLHAQNNSMRLASLEWAPYVGSQLLEEGLTASIVHTVSKQAGLKTQINYMPWSRAMQIGSIDPSYAGYFPAYYFPEREKTCHFSGEIGRSEIGFAYLKGHDFHWDTLEDLRPIEIGVVRAYANGVAFDTMVKNGELKTDIAPSDISNLRKLVAKRIQVAVIDRAVLRQLLSVDPSLQADKEQILFHPHVMTLFSMRICFQRTDLGLALQTQFDAELKKVNLKKLESAYFQSLSSTAKAPK